MLNKEKPVTINVDAEKCTKCGICIKNCPGYLIIDNNEIKANEDSLFGCIQCGRCMMTCPNNAISVQGEAISKEDVIDLTQSDINFLQLQSLLLKRRSIREYKQEDVPKELIEKIIEAASTSAVSIPPTEVKILVINGRDKVQQFADDVVNSFKVFFKKVKILKLFKPFMKKEIYKFFNEFVIPLTKETVKQRENGKDILLYNAPCVILFYKRNLADKEDAIIAATTATIAAETLGLGTCIIGSVPPTMNKNKKLRAKYGIPKDEDVSTALILGFPKEQLKKGITRRFKEVKFY